MCYYISIEKNPEELKNRFSAQFQEENEFQPGIFNGFKHPRIPVITNKNNTKIQLFSWGLIPKWAKDSSFQKYTLNAKIETISEKPAFKEVALARCLVLVDSFFEWQWLDSKGVKKQKYKIGVEGKKAFAIGGLYSYWSSVNSAVRFPTVTILTREANELMSRIHNTKKRMPLILSKKNEMAWLSGETDESGELELIAAKI